MRVSYQYTSIVLTSVASTQSISRRFTFLLTATALGKTAGVNTVLSFSYKLSYFTHHNEFVENGSTQIKLRSVTSYTHRSFFEPISYGHLTTNLLFSSFLFHKFAPLNTSSKLFWWHHYSHAPQRMQRQTTY